MASKLFFSLDTVKPQTNTSAGSLTSVTSKETPGLVNISFANLKLKQRGSLAPIWHPNANKIGYCVEGNILVSIRTPGKIETFTVKKGEIFFIPQGYVHHIENIHDNESVVSFALNHSVPETMFFSKAVASISDTVFNSTFNTKTGFVDGLKKTNNEDLIKTLPPLKKTPSPIASAYKFDIEDSKKAILTKGGYVQLGTKTSLPKLQGLGILGFGLNPKGSVEPHWHTNAGELVYIVKGHTRITVLSPDGNVDVLEVKGGQGAFAPASHFHNIENIGPDEVEVIAFFSHEDPDYIGIGEVVGSYSNELLTSVFNTPATYWDTFVKTEKPLVIVPI
ncbi:MAG: cupin domain-containing protein [Parachlamydiales bacterium]|jgi:oxalate decarboxylase